MTTIKATTETFLKKEVAQASDLPENKKVQVDPGKIYQILNYAEAEQGHYQVELNYGAGTWYLWSGHWELPWEDNQEQADTTKADFFTPENLIAFFNWID